MVVLVQTRETKKRERVREKGWRRWAKGIVRAQTEFRAVRFPQEAVVTFSNPHNLSGVSQREGIPTEANTSKA